MKLKQCNYSKFEPPVQAHDVCSCGRYAFLLVTDQTTYHSPSLVVVYDVSWKYFCHRTTAGIFKYTIQIEKFHTTRKILSKRFLNKGCATIPPRFCCRYEIKHYHNHNIIVIVYTLKKLKHFIFFHITDYYTENRYHKLNCSFLFAYV